VHVKVKYKLIRLNADSKSNAASAAGTSRGLAFGPLPRARLHGGWTGGKPTQRGQVPKREATSVRQV